MNVSTVDSRATSKLYSPTQAALGTLLGGPLALVYFSAANFKASHEISRARNMIIAGVVWIVTSNGLAVGFSSIPPDLITNTVLILGACAFKVLYFSNACAAWYIARKQTQ